MKINYQKKMEDILSSLTNKPTLLLHSCCAPCSSYVLECLRPHFHIIDFYYNPNIEPESEYIKRADELKRFLTQTDPDKTVSFIQAPYEPEKFRNRIRGLEQIPEGGARCFACYALRLEESAKKAQELHCDYFTTTLSISPYKNAEKLNQIGQQLQEKYQVKYLFSDFKKKNGYLRSIELSQQYNLYRQPYCGCIFSRQEQEQRRQKTQTSDVT